MELSNVFFCPNYKSFRKKTMGLFALKALVAVCMVSCASSCKCVYKGPQFLQDIYCNAKYVIRVTVVGNEEEVDYQRKYTVSGTILYKSSAEYDAVIDKNSIYTGLSGASCGVYLEVGSSYIISGGISNGKLTINTCGSFYRAVEEFTAAQICYLSSSSGYAKGCRYCTIQYCENAEACGVIPWNSGSCIGNQDEGEFTPLDENSVCTRVTQRFYWFYFSFCQWKNLGGPLGSNICQTRG